MIRLWLVIYLTVSLCLPALAIALPAEYAGFVKTNENAGKTWTRKVCERFSVCEQVSFDYNAAIVIGVSEYEHLPDLDTAKRDPEKVLEFLVDSGEFDEIVYLANADAEKETIEFFMEDYFPAKFRETPGRFLFYFSGHGKARDGRGYLRLADNAPDMYSRAIPMDSIQSWALNNLSGALHSLFIIDSCMSGLVGSERKAELSTDENPAILIAGSASIVMTAGDEDQEVVTGDRWGGSLFTEALLQGLTDGSADAAPADGIITATEMFQFADAAVVNEVGLQQTPQRRELRRELHGDFFFLNPRYDERREVIAAEQQILQTKSEDGTISLADIADQLYADLSESKDLSAINGFLNRFPDSTHYAGALELKDQVLQGRVADPYIPEWQKWSYWKDRALWDSDAIYCSELNRFLGLSRNVSQMETWPQGRPVNLAEVGSEPTKLSTSYFVRYPDDSSTPHYCGVSQREDDTVIACSRRISQDVDIMFEVYRQTLQELRSCIVGSGWRERSAQDKPCYADFVAGENCNHTFSRGPQHLWLYGDLFDGDYTLGIQITVDRNSGLPIQGSYQLGADGALTVSGDDDRRFGEYLFRYDLVIDRLVEFRRAIGTSDYVGYSYVYDDSRVSEVVVDAASPYSIYVSYSGDDITGMSTSLGDRLTISYNEIGKINVVQSSKYGAIAVTYDDAGNVADVDGLDGADASAVAGELDLLLDAVGFAD